MRAYALLYFENRSRQMMQMNVDEELIRERENDIIELTK